MGILDEFDATESVSSEKSESGRSSRRKRLLNLFGVFMLLAIAIGGSIYVIKSKPEILGLTKGSSVSQKEIDDMIERVGKIIELPDGETPTLATVTDLEKVGDQAFFKKAKVGDKVLVYQKAGKAYLYRPTDNKIVEVGVVNTNSPLQDSGEVAGDNSEIPVVTPTALPTVAPVMTSTVTPRPTTIPTNLPTQSFVSPTVTPAQQ